MPELSYKALDAEIQAADQLRSCGVILIWGEEALCAQALKKIAIVLLPDGRRNPAFETIDGGDLNVPLAVERISTYSLLSGGRAILLKDSSVFYTRQDRRALLKRAAAAFADGRMKPAADWLLKLLAGENLGLADVSPKRFKRLLGRGDDDVKNLAWMLEVVDYCRKQGLEVPADEDAAGLIKRAVENGFPKGNYLLITSGKIRKTTGLYRAIKKVGLVVDCSVPGSGRMVDKRARSQLLQNQAREILSKSGKSITSDAMVAVEEMTGFDLRVFAHNMEKLVSYAGKQDRITRAHVDKVLSRSKRDPLYEFTNAVFDRRLEDSLFFLKSLLADGIHPLQLLAAMINQVRRLILVRDFILGKEGAAWQGRMGYDRFQAQVLPSVKKHDAALQQMMASWEQEVGRHKKSDEGGPGRKKKIPPANFMLLRKGASPFALYMLFKKCEPFRLQELVNLMVFLKKTDLGLKTSPQHPEILLEAVVVRICRKLDAGS